MEVFQQIVGYLMKLLEIRSFIIFCLILQSTLVLLAPIRKKTSNTAITTFLWLQYTVSGLAWSYAVGLVTTATIVDDQEQPKAPPPLMLLWTPFIFLHLTSADTITAFSLEDTNSWFRNTFRLLLTGIAVSRAMAILLTRTKVALAANLICLASATKFYETMQCLFLGNLTRFKTFTKPIYSRTSESVSKRRVHAYEEARITPPDGSKLRDGDVARDAFGFFQTFKGIFANVVFNSQHYIHSRDYFLSRDVEDVFAVVETELNFGYDILYTKRLVLTRRFDQGVRLFSVLVVFAAFLVWNSVDKRELDKVDVRITHALTLSAVILEIVFILIHLLSDWFIGRVLLKYGEETPLAIVSHKFISLKKKFGLLSRRWSGSVSRYSLIMWCTSKSDPRVEKVLGWMKIKDFIYNSRNMSPVRFDDKLRDFVFNELRYRSLKAENLLVAKKMSFARGDWILRDYYHDNPLILTFSNTWFGQSHLQLHRIVLLWHVATDLCYYAYASDTNDHEEKERRELSKIISDYMAFILIREQSMLSEVAGEAKATFQHTCDEVVKMLVIGDMEGFKGKEEKVEKACVVIMENPDPVVEDVDDVNDQKKNSVLKDAGRLSKELKEMMDHGFNMWEVMSKVWVELLCYSACNCKASEHAAQLCKGGQLLTIVWLLMAHLGLTNRV